MRHEASQHSLPLCQGLHIIQFYILSPTNTQKKPVVALQIFELDALAHAVTTSAMSDTRARQAVLRQAASQHSLLLRQGLQNK